MRKYEHINILGKRFGRWLVVRQSDRRDKGRNVYWECRCDCGSIKSINTRSLRSGNSRSCGCLQREYAAGKITHGMAIGHGKVKGTILPREYTMWCSSKNRAKRDGIPFNLELFDIVIPEFCPVFTDVKLNRNNKRTSFDSPSLDRIIPELGYIKGNVRVISYRANTMKQDASLAEIKRLAEWLEGELHG